jgi:hypothetical protein
VPAKTYRELTHSKSQPLDQQPGRYQMSSDFEYVRETSTENGNGAGNAKLDDNKEAMPQIEAR